MRLIYSNWLLEKERKRLIKIVTLLALESGNPQSSKVAKTPGVRKRGSTLRGFCSKLIEKHSDTCWYFFINRPIFTLNNSMKDHTSTSLVNLICMVHSSDCRSMKPCFLFLFPLLLCDMSHGFQKNADDTGIALSISIENEKLILTLCYCGDIYNHLKDDI